MKNSGNCNVVLLVFLMFIALCWIVLYYSNQHPCIHSEEKIEDIIDTTYNFEKHQTYVDYYLDSAYKIVLDSQITIYNNKTGNQLKKLDYMPYEMKSISIHPSGKYVVIFDEMYISVYSLTKNEEEPCSQTSVDEEFQILEFSKNGKYLIVLNYRDPEVMILSFPGLRDLAHQYLGYYRNNYYWEEHAGKLIFYYEEIRDSKIYYRTVFPANQHARTRRFSEPALVDTNLTKIKVNL